MSILMSFFWFSFINTSLSCLLFLFFSLFNFDFTIFSLCYSIKYLGKPKLWSSTIGQFGKTAFTAEFLTVANTLSMYWSKNTQPTKYIYDYWNNQFYVYVSGQAIFQDNSRQNVAIGTEDKSMVTTYGKEIVA